MEFAKQALVPNWSLQRFADPPKVLEIHQIQQRSTPRSKDPPNPTIKPVPIATTVMFKKKKMILLIFHLMPDGFHHQLLPDGLHHLNLSPDGVDHGLLRVQSLAGHPSPCQVAKLLQKSKLRKSQIISRSSFFIFSCCSNFCHKIVRPVSWRR